MFNLYVVEEAFWQGTRNLLELSWSTIMNCHHLLIDMQFFLSNSGEKFAYHLGAEMTSEIIQFCWNHKLLIQNTLLVKYQITHIHIPYSPTKSIVYKRIYIYIVYSSKVNQSDFFSVFCKYVYHEKTKCNLFMDRNICKLFIFY